MYFYSGFSDEDPGMALPVVFTIDNGHTICKTREYIPDEANAMPKHLI